MFSVSPTGKNVKGAISKEEKERVTRLVEWLLANAAVVNDTPKGRIVINFAGNSLHYEFVKAGEICN